MVKLVIAFRRKPGLDIAEFKEIWCGEHAALTRRLAPVLGVERYVQSVGLDSELVAQFAAGRGFSGTFDGVAEIYWASEDALAAAAGSVEGQAAFAELAQDEVRFCDPATAVAFLTEENIVIGG